MTISLAEITVPHYYIKHTKQKTPRKGRLSRHLCCYDKCEKTSHSQNEYSILP
jgi:hypothetical protein